jgi:hypothetical protein
LYFRSVRVFALPRFCRVPEYLSRGFAKHVHHVVFRHILWRVFEKNAVPVFAAGNYGAVG